MTNTFIFSLCIHHSINKEILLGKHGKVFLNIFPMDKMIHNDTSFSSQAKSSHSATASFICDKIYIYIYCD